MRNYRLTARNPSDATSQLALHLIVNASPCTTPCSFARHRKVTTVKALQNLELHVAHSCNLTCESCSHYSNQGPQGHRQPGRGRSVDGKLEPPTGPEGVLPAWGRADDQPTVAGDRRDGASALAARASPHCHQRLLSPPTPDSAAGPSIRQQRRPVSLHSPRFARIPRKTQTYFFLARGMGQNPPDQGRGVRIIQELDAPVPWIRLGHRLFEDNQPRLSWERCPARSCRQLFEGQIWKCGPIAYLKLQHDRHGLSEKWNSYLAYAPLSPDCSDEQLNEFLDREDESCCSMCPAEPAKLPCRCPRRAKPLPLTVSG